MYTPPRKNNEKIKLKELSMYSTQYFGCIYLAGHILGGKRSTKKKLYSVISIDICNFEVPYIYEKKVKSYFLYHCYHG